MISMSLNRAAGLLKCEPFQGDIAFAGITSDSRQLVPGMLFAALPGQAFDGHDYIPQAMERGAIAALVSRDVPTDLPLLQVTDVVAALGTLAGYWRKECSAKVIGITGSNGKTTVKEMVANILRQDGLVLATGGNFNNELGLPLTVFQLDKSHDFAVLEMGASNPGDIAYLAGIAKPDVGVITNIGPAHLQGFINIQGVARAKGELFAALSHNGAAIINAAEPWVELWQDLNKAETTWYFNGDGKNDVRAHHAGDEVVVITPAGEFPLQLPLPGLHNLTNALAATAVCLALDVPLTHIRSGLETVKPVPGRLSLKHASAGWTVIDDTYNANPASLYAALQVLSTQSGEPWLVMGDMKELGSDSRKMHAELGDAARSLGVRRLFALGEASAAAVDAFGDRAVHFSSRDGLIEALRAELKPGVACLVKGSRSMGMEHVVNAISNGHEYAELNG
ncbi:MAG: UDP-N-acetylmuramoyl-tripeptide--D-alanyl-D-alanine ligase [Xanthomonadales bacterium]|nr:UDP-N-acetylmuramoyl-tripeptide--D-alanyl-D-alanine ligase [Xanthomonadales bacterium]